MTILETMIQLVKDEGYFLEEEVFDNGTKTYTLTKDLGGGDALVSHQMGFKAVKILQNKTNVELKKRHKIAVACGYCVNKLIGTEVIEL